MALSTLGLSAIPAKLAIPAAVSLFVGAAAAGVYFSQPTPVEASVIASAPAPETASAPAAQDATRTCELQSWPYTCAAEGSTPSRSVRVVMAPPSSEASKVTGPIPAPEAAIEEANKAIKLMSRTTVLRAPELVPVPKAVKREKRNDMPREARRASREQRWAAQSYQVPADDGASSRAIVVVRPLRRADSMD
jgi:hypothetical protein